MTYPLIVPCVSGKENNVRFEHSPNSDGIVPHVSHSKSEVMEVHVPKEAESELNLCILAIEREREREKENVQI